MSRWVALGLLFLANALNFFDRQVLGALAEPIRREWALSDAALGWLSTSFTLLYAVAGIPLGRLADRAMRTRILAAGLFVWSICTALSARARSAAELFALRLLVGVGEASCAPAATSLVGDLFPAQQRGRALAVFMLGLPLGLAASYAVGTRVAAEHGWRAAFLVAGLPGVLVAGLLLLVREPARGAAEAVQSAPAHPPAAPLRTAASLRTVARIPTVLWLSLAGALHNFTLYAVSAFIAPLLMRWHGLQLREAGDAAMVVNGLAGIPGMLIGGYVGDRLRARNPGARVLAGAAAALVALPLAWFAFARMRGDVMPFLVAMGVAYAALSAIYSIAYPAIQDVVEPGLRGTAMAVYFLAMYLLGASLGPALLGHLSDHFAAQAASAVGAPAAETFRAAGLRQALLWTVPPLLIGLAAALVAASRTADRDAARAQAGRG